MKPLCWPRNTLYPQKLALISPTSGGRSEGIVSSRTKARELVGWLVGRLMLYTYILLRETDVSEEPVASISRTEVSPKL
jgi:hypothetical protein